MKYYSIILLSFFFSMTLSAQTQKGVSLYGYVQAVTKGMAGKERDENGKAKKTPSKLYNYYLYLSSSLKNRIYPAEIWIKGERLGVQYETVNQTPVTISKDDAILNSEQVILVPETTAKVLRLTGTKETQEKNFSKAKNLAANNDLVVVYKTGGKFYYATLKKFTELGGGAMQ